jgi:integrase
MSNIFKRKGFPNYYCRFQYMGKDYLYSTGTRNRDDALKLLKQKQAEVTNTVSIDETVSKVLQLLVNLPKDDQEKRRTEIARRIVQGKATKLSFQEAWQAWLDIPKKTGASTIVGYNAAWKRFAHWAETRKLQFLHEVTEIDVQDYAADLWQSRISTSTFNTHKRFLTGLFRKLKAKAGLVINPWDCVASLEKEHEGRRNLTMPELQKVIGSATGNMQSMFMIGLFTALRLADVVNLRKDAVNLKENMLEVIPVKTKRLNKKIRIPIHTILRPRLEHLMKTVEGDYFFPKEKELHAKGSSEITKHMQKHFEACGLQTTEKSANLHRRRVIVRVGFHSLRHSFVSLMAAGGAPQYVIQQLVGHGSPAMTEHYTHLDDTQKTTAMAALPANVFEDKSKDKQ